MSVTRAAIRFVVLSTLATVLLLVASGGAGDSLPAAAYLAVIAAIAAVEALRWMRIATRAAPDPVAPLLRRRPPPPGARPTVLLGLEALVDGACLSGRAARVRLQPRLRELARHRLAVRRGIDLHADPAAAAAVLGPDAWALLAPPAGRVPEPEDPGVPLDAIAAAVDALEAL